MVSNDTSPPDHLSTAQTARVLGVKQQTVYAYVSRGMLPRVTVPGRRGSWFPADVVESLRSQGPRNRLSGLAERIRTRITLIEDDRLHYRGREATALAATSSFEDVCALLWESDPAPLPDLGTAVVPEVGEVRMLDRIRTAISVHAGREPLRGDLSPAAVVRSARNAVAAAIDALPLRGPVLDTPGAAARLWPRLTERPATADTLRVLEAALILLADHELASSSTAARVAAATRADPYGVLMAALGTMDSPWHGAASSVTRRLLDRAGDDPDPVIAEHLVSGLRPPGFGHLVYVDHDPRAEFLLSSMAELQDVDRRPLEAARRMIDEWDGRRGWYPNTDLALAVLGRVLDMPVDAGDAIFTIARLAGWTAHALEEYAEPPMRFRLHALYVGLRPSDPGAGMPRGPVRPDDG